ncbi:MAG TPA: carboxypeptidase-like regulatory domain-containing protein [Candidatus Thermoplasmatota archaeon]|nr:carboxypeptidase-like regulatory domain-containing protein [Candidatus Thermoplasmatota archaeon]
MSLGSTSTGAVLVILVAGLVAFAPQTAFAQSTTILEGTVTDAETGKPLAAYIRVSSWQGETADNRHYDETKTDENGVFRIEVPGDRGHLQVVAADQAHHTYDLKWSASDAAAPLAIALKPFPPKDAVVSGVVVDAVTGKPIAGAHVSISPDWSTKRGEPATPPEAALVDPAAGSEKPASEPIRCCAEYPSDHASMTTGEDGRYRFAVYAGAHQIAVSASNYAYLHEKVTLAEGDEKALDLALEPVPKETVVVRGVVRDASTGLPIENAHVSIQNLEWSRWNGTQTDRLGRFEIRTLPGFTQISVHSWGVGRVTLEATDATASDDIAVGEGEVAATRVAAPGIMPAPSGGPAYYTWILSLRLESGEREITIDLKPKPAPSIPLVGYIVDGATKKAIPHAWINIQNEDTGEWGHAQADKDGSYKILVRPGYHIVNAHADGYFQKTVIREIEKGEGAVRFDVVLEPGTPKYAPYPYYAVSDASVGHETREKSTAGGVSDAPSAPSNDLARASGDGATRQGAASYQGGAGNLGPYDPDAAPGKLPGKPLPTPGLAGVAAVAVLAIAALALHRKHR